MKKILFGFCVLFLLTGCNVWESNSDYGYKGEYGIDNGKVYYKNSPAVKAQFISQSPAPILDKLKSLGHGYVTDGKYLFFRGKIIKDASTEQYFDASTLDSFKVITHDDIDYNVVAKDKNNVFLEDSWLSFVSDVKSFNSDIGTWGGFMRDKYHIYGSNGIAKFETADSSYPDVKYFELDPAAVEYIDYGYLRGDKYIYHRLTRDSYGIFYIYNNNGQHIYPDPSTFRFKDGDSQYAMDKNNCYHIHALNEIVPMLNCK